MLLENRVSFRIASGTVPAVLWSGGLDSTFMLLRLLEEYRAPLDNIMLLSFDTYHRATSVKEKPADMSPQAKRERKARRVLLKMLEKDFPKTKFNDYNIPVLMACSGGRRVGVFLYQPIRWLFEACTFLPQESTIFYGLVKGDQGLTQLDKSAAFFDFMKQLYESPDLHLRLPLVDTSKWEIIQVMRKYHPKYLNHISYCEYPDDTKPCNVSNRGTLCHSCKTHFLNQEIADKITIADTAVKECSEEEEAVYDTHDEQVIKEEVNNG